MTNKIILFFPKLEEKLLEESERQLLPLSVLLVAAPLVDNGYKVKIIDQRFDDNWQTTLLAELKTEPLLVGFSVLTGKQIEYALAASELVKKNSLAKVVWGGVHPSLLPEQTLQNELIDVVVIGEGEETLLDLANQLKDGRPISGVSGVGWKKEGQIIINEPRPFICLDDQPEIPYQLVKIENYISKISFATGRPAREIALYTSRGCPHHCAFCYNEKYNLRRWRGQSAERIFSDIRNLWQNYNIDAFSLQDDEFFVDLGRAAKLCQMLEGQKIQATFFASCRIDYIDKRMDDNFLKLVERNGFKTMAVGVESGSPKILEMIHKGITPEQVIFAAKKLKQHNIGGKYYFMVGFPGETIEDMRQTADLMRAIKVQNPYERIPAWRIYTPYPGTELYEVAVQEGFRPPATLAGWSKFNFETVKIPWLSWRQKQIIKNVAWLAKFLRLQDKKLSWQHKLFGQWVDWRFRNHFFTLVIERYLVDLRDRFGKLNRNRVGG